MISLNQLSVYFGGVPLFNNISFLVNQQDKIGLTGKNGAGKSTMLKLISGQMRPEEGNLAYPKECTIGYLPQEMNHNKGLTIVEEARKAFAELQKLEAKVERLTEEISNRDDYDSDEYMDLVQMLSSASERQGLLGGGNVDGEIERTLTGLGFSVEDMRRNMETFSGGWQMRVELAKILLQRPDLILLDEPTNHLDIESIQWLENFLSSYPGAVILVSHDRAFLDKITNRTIEIVAGRIEDYKANYSRYVELRAERRAQQLATQKNQQKMIEQQERFIERFRSKASKATAVQSRIKQLDKIERIEIDEEDNASIRFRFPDAPRSGKIVVEGRDVSKTYATKLVLDHIDFDIVREDKVAFVGRNGEGKSTLSKIIIGQLDKQGTVNLGYNVEVGYYAQNQADLLDMNKTVLETMEAAATGPFAGKARNILGSFLFSGDAVDKKVSVLSGGEKARLAMALLLLKPANLLVLDEPTNHLDMRSKDILKEALINYTGTLVLVSHDRDFLDGICNRVFEFRDHKIKEYPMGVKEYLSYRKLNDFKALETQQKQKKEQQQKAEQKQVAPMEQKNYAEQKEVEKEQRKKQNRLSKVESLIAELEKEQKQIEAKLSDSEIFKDAAQSNTLLRRFDEVKAELEKLMEEWESLSV
ncbi:MAG: ABC-F family ATP-binding cassette domain-containing protein [Flavobacteriales bacterium]